MEPFIIRRRNLESYATGICIAGIGVFLIVFAYLINTYLVMLMALVPLLMVYVIFFGGYIKITDQVIATGVSDNRKRVELGGRRGMIRSARFDEIEQVYVGPFVSYIEKDDTINQKMNDADSPWKEAAMTVVKHAMTKVGDCFIVVTRDKKYIFEPLESYSKEKVVRLVQELQMRGIKVELDPEFNMMG